MSGTYTHTLSKYTQQFPPLSVTASRAIRCARGPPNTHVDTHRPALACFVGSSTRRRAPRFFRHLTFCLRLVPSPDVRLVGVSHRQVSHGRAAVPRRNPTTYMRPVPPWSVPRASTLLSHLCLPSPLAPRRQPAAARLRSAVFTPYYWPLPHASASPFIPCPRYQKRKTPRDSVHVSLLDSSQSEMLDGLLRPSSRPILC